MPLWRKVLFMLVLFGLPLALTYLEGVRPSLLNRRNLAFCLLSDCDGYLHTCRRAVDLADAAGSGRGFATAGRCCARHRRCFGAQNSVAQLAGGLDRLDLVSSVGWYWALSPLPPELRYWSGRYWMATILIMYGALAWLIYATMGSARLTALLHRYVQHKDPLDLTAFEPVGRQGLILAMIFVGTITLSLLFIYTPTMFLDWRGIVVYSILVLVTVSIFFNVMWPAHRVLLPRQGAETHQRPDD